jgi:ATP-binding cassette subfamily B protein/subfamily B ATP-binding cassette protein MsbA
MQQDELMGKIYDSRLFKRLIIYLKPYLKYIIIAFVLLILNTAGEMYMPILIKTAVDEHIVPDNRMITLDYEAFQIFKKYHDFSDDRFGIYVGTDRFYVVVSGIDLKHLERDLLRTYRENNLISDDKVVVFDTHGMDIEFWESLKSSALHLRAYDILHEELLRERLHIYGEASEHSIDLTAIPPSASPGRAFIAYTLPELYRLPIPDILRLRGDSVSAIKLIGLLLLIIVLVKFFIGFLQLILTTIASQKAMHDLRSGLFSHLQRMPTSFFDKNPVGRLVTRVTNDIRAIDEMLTSGVITIIQDFFMVVAIMVLMLILNWQLALVSFIVIPFVVWLIAVFKAKTRESYREMRKWLAAVNATLAEHISGVKIIQLFNQYIHKEKDFENSNQKYYVASMRQLKLFSIFRPLIGVSRNMATAIILWYAGGQILENIITIGLFMAFINYMEKLYEPINNFTEKFNILQGAMAGAERIFDLMDQMGAQYRTDRVAVEKIAGEIEFRDVWLTYSPPDISTKDMSEHKQSEVADSSWVLKNISFKVKPGEKIAIVGHTGSGKTSIVNLILDMYPHQRGDILINGTKIDDYRLHDLRANIGMVQQDIFLFSGTIRDNIILNNASITDEQINKITDYVNVSAFISSLPDKLDEPVQERGSTFSVGQRQLISFARVLAYDPSIFILDEATSNIDTETEVLIQDALFKIMKNRTSIIIAHRLSTIQHVDRILVLHKGEIVEEGSHQDLLKKEGLYYDLYRLQYT